MEQIVAPGIYCREPSALGKAGKYAVKLGTTACLLGGNTALVVAGAAVTQALNAEGIKVTGQLWFGGECTWAQVEALSGREEVRRADIIIGVGGGKALDTAKLLAYKTGKRLINVPTVAATCAAWTPISIVYDESGTFIEVSPKASNPDVVLADTTVLVNAPVRYLVAGIGDTLAKWYEGEASTRGRTMGQNAMAALSLARLVCERLYAQSAEALAAVRKGVLTTAVDEVVDAIIMVAGMISNLGGDDCRAAAAHSVYSAFTLLPAIHSMVHGEVVGYGILCQLIMDNAPETEIDRYLAFSRRIGLPVTLDEMGLADVTEAEVAAVAKLSLDIPEMVNMPYPVTQAMVAEAIMEADRRGRQLKL